MGTHFIGLIQAHMGSTRLPGKVLKEIDGESLLKIMTDRLKGFDIAVITSGSPKDDAIVDWCKASKVKYFRGSDRDVLDRYYRASQYFNADLIGRLCSDCPLIDPAIIEIALESMGDYEMVGNYDRENKGTYPDGMDIEIFTRDALKKTWLNAVTPYDREHVTPWAWANLNCLKLNAPEDCSSYRFTVDTEGDFDYISGLYRRIKREEVFGSYDELIRYA